MKPIEVFSSFSVRDVSETKQFYSDVLGLEIEDGKMGLILHMVGGGIVFMYPKDNHEPASFTVLNLKVENIEEAVDDLMQHEVELERYEGMGQDEKGISRGKESQRGPDIAWFKDPSGNIIAVVEQ